MYINNITNTTTLPGVVEGAGGVTIEH